MPGARDRLLVVAALHALAVALALWRGSGEGSQATADTVLLTALAALAACAAFAASTIRATSASSRFASKTMPSSRSIRP